MAEMPLAGGHYPSILRLFTHSFIQDRFPCLSGTLTRTRERW